jgi:ribosomal protein S27AE
MTARVRLGRYIVDLVKVSRKAYKCQFCGADIPEGTSYYRVTRGGSGLASIKFPDRACPSCIRKLERGEVL